MRKFISIQNILLIILSVTVLLLVFKVFSISSIGTTYLQNNDGGFNIVETSYGGFPVKIDETKAVDDGTQLTLDIVNPFNIHFANAEISVSVYDTTETVTMNLLPSTNRAQFRVPFIQRGHPIDITLKVDKIYF